MFRRRARGPSGFARERRRGAERITALTVSVALVVLAAACSSNQGGPTTTSSSSTTTTTTTTTSSTTTTLPVPIAGTSIFRARVAALSAGDVALPAISEGSAAWSKMVPIAYQTFGSGPDLLLIAGQDGTMSWWDPALLSDLSSHYTVTMFDLPGAGYSGPATSPLSLPWLADMTAGLVLTLGLSDPIALGWGLGGEIALSLAERHPEIASSLVLVDSSAGGAGASRPPPAVVRLLATPDDTPSELAGLLFPPTTTGVRERAQWQSYLFQGSPDWLTAPTIKAEAALQASLWKSAKLLDYLPRVRIPVLVVSGADDIVFPTANATELATRLYHASLDILPAAGYDAMAQDEPAFVAAVERFTG